MLNFYSPSAYNYVCETFDKCLLHPSTRRKWYSQIDGKPGFTSEALNAITIKLEEMKEKGKADLSMLNPKPYFKQLSTEELVHITLDAAHMI